MCGIADLGCGIGYTTAGLKELFPHSDVYGVEIDESNQMYIALENASKYNFSVSTSIKENTDIIFASEYFEHFENPIKHLDDVLQQSKAKVIIAINSFASRSVGHFNNFIVNSDIVHRSKMGRIFNAALRERGFQKLPIQAWNSRPSIYVRQL